MKEDPGQFIVRKAEKLLPRPTRRRVPAKLEEITAKLLAMGYGTTFGALYAMARPKTKQMFLEGTVVGVASWAASFLGWLPATGLMPPVWKHRPKQIIMPIVEHTFYGVATVATYRWLQRLARLKVGMKH